MRLTRMASLKRVQVGCFEFHTPRVLSDAVGPGVVPREVTAAGGPGGPTAAAAVGAGRR